MAEVTESPFPERWQPDAQPIQTALSLGEALRLVPDEERPRRRYQPRRDPAEHQFVRTPIAMIRDSRIADGAFRTWEILATYATGVDLQGKGGLVQQPNGKPLALGQLAADRSISQRWVSDHLKQLAAAGYITVSGGNGSRLTIRVLWITNHPPARKRGR